MGSIKKSGFTIIEIMIVVALIGLLAVVGVPYILGAYANSLDQIKCRNLTEVEKAKAILTLPASVGIIGAAGLQDPELQIDEQPALLEMICSALSIDDMDDLKVGGDNVQVGSLSSKAVYAAD